MSDRVEIPWWEDDKTDTGYSSMAEASWSNEPYQFNLTRVYVENETGELFYAQDIGCSCPTPFENTVVSDLRPIKSVHDWNVHAEEMMSSAWDSDKAVCIDSAYKVRAVISEYLNNRQEISL